MSLGTSNLPLAMQSSAIARLRARMEVLQSEVSTGTHAKLGQTLGVRSGALVESYQKTTAISGYQANINVLKIQMTSATNALDQLNTKVEDFRTALLQYQGGAGSRSSVQQAAKTLLEELPSIFGDAAGGGNLFAGQTGKTDAVSDYYADQGSLSRDEFQQATVQYFGFDPSASSATGIDASQISGFLASRVQTYDDTQGWSQLWTGDVMVALKIPIGEGKSVSLPTLTDMSALRSITAMATTFSEAGNWDLNENAFSALVSGGLAEMSTAQKSLTNERTLLGEKTKMVEDVETRNSGMKSTLEEYRATQENVDQFAAMTELSDVKSRLEASYSMTSSLSELLLAKYLR